MNFICKACKEAGSDHIGQPKECRGGTWCDCQHKGDEAPK